ncbi:MAG: chemotaxis protein [Rubrivivax sp.]|nr:chemotaxis protein [Rubrivivax sp.]
MKFTDQLTAVAVAPLVLALAATGVSLWGQTSTQRAFDGYIQTEEALATGLTEMYAHGLQMGQALRNITLARGDSKAQKNLEAARAGYDDTYAALLKLGTDAATQTALKSLEGPRDRHRAAQDRILGLVKKDPEAAVRDIVATETPAWRDLKAALLSQAEQARKAASARHEAMTADARRNTLVAGALAGGAALVSFSLLLILRRRVRQELGGDPKELRSALQRIATGDLTVPMGTEADTGDSVMASLGRMQGELRQLVGEMRAAICSVSTASDEIASGNMDLSTRTESTASHLQQAATSVAGLDASTAHTASTARAADRMASEAATVADQGGALISQVVATMDDISSSSKRIADIIGVIDGIAFQTNILALNAAVEAARAGEQGRGFAVVAGEVRTLARRAADAAKEIKTLILASETRVDAGAQLVNDAGRVIHDIVASARKVAETISEIAKEADTQSHGIREVGGTVDEVDRMTQQNAALVEQSAAATASLSAQAHRLDAVVRRFHLGTA